MVIVLIALCLAQQPTGVTQQVFEVSGQVDRIDRAGRTVSITSADVVSAPIYVGPDLPIFDQLNSGDVVTVRYYDSVIVEVTPGERMTSIEDTTGAAQKMVDRADARILQQTRLVVTIDALDVENATVTYHGFDNRRVFRVVRDRRLMEGVKPGDVVTITFTRAQAVAITKAPQQTKGDTGARIANIGVSERNLLNLPVYTFLIDDGFGDVQAVRLLR